MSGDDIPFSKDFINTIPYEMLLCFHDGVRELFQEKERQAKSLTSLSASLASAQQDAKQTIDALCEDLAALRATGAGSSK
jgi:hypothetical protein